jgi:hypothetical protein
VFRNGWMAMSEDGAVTPEALRESSWLRTHCDDCIVTEEHLHKWDDLVLAARDAEAARGESTTKESKLLGGSHSRTTVAGRYGVSLPTADRWLPALRTIPGVSTRRIGKVTAYVWRPTRLMMEMSK